MVEHDKASSPGDVVADVEARVLPEIRTEYRGVLYTLEGQQAEQRDTLGGLFRGFVLALLIIYALLAIPLRSYLQPLVIMAVTAPGWPIQSSRSFPVLG